MVSRRTKPIDAPTDVPLPASPLRTAATVSRDLRTRKTPPPDRTAPTAKTVPGELTVSTTPTSRGPARVLTLSIQPETTFIAARSSGRVASPGANEACAGRVIVYATEGSTRRA